MILGVVSLYGLMKELCIYIIEFICWLVEQDQEFG